MQIQIIPLIIVLAYLVGMLVVGFIVGKLKIKNSKDYMVAGRRMGLFMVAFSLSANNIGGGCTTGLAQKAFGNWGMSACWYVLAASIAMIPLAFFAPKIRKTMAVTIPEVVGRRFGKVSSIFTSILSVLSLFCLTSSQIAASGSVINALIPSIPLNVCLIFAGIVIILYTTFGGMIADQISDLVQFIIILVGLAIATPIVLKCAGGWEAISAKLPAAKLSFTEIGWASIIGYIFQLLALATSFWTNTLNLRDIIGEQTKWSDRLSWFAASFPCLLLSLIGLSDFVSLARFAGVIQVVTGLGIILAYAFSRKRVGKSDILGFFGVRAFRITVAVCTLLATVGSIVSVS